MKNEKKPLDRKKLVVLGVLFLLGLLLLFWGSFDGKTESADEVPSEMSAEDYRVALAKEIEVLCQGVKGVGKVTVLVSLAGGYEYVYARDEDGDCVEVGSGSKKEAVVEKVLPPKIAGVGIVCDGGGNASVREALTSLLSAALGIGANKIYITA